MFLPVALWCNLSAFLFPYSFGSIWIWQNQFPVMSFRRLLNSETSLWFMRICCAQPLNRKTSWISGIFKMAVWFRVLTPCLFFINQLRLVVGNFGKLHQYKQLSIFICWNIHICELFVLSVKECQNHALDSISSLHITVHAIIQEPQNVRLNSVMLNSVLLWDPSNFSEGNVTYTIQYER